MKDFDPNKNQQDNKIVAAETRQAKAEQQKISMLIRPGHTVWEFQLDGGIINKAKIEKVEAVLSVVDPMAPGKTKNIRSKVIQRPRCMYAAALNYNNALKRFVEMYDELLALGAVERPTRPKKTPLEAWLCMTGGWDIERMAILMFNMITDNPHEDNQVFDLLEATGDAEYSQASFLKAAELILAKE